MFSKALSITFVFTGKAAKIFSRPFFLCVRYLVGVPKKTFVTTGKMFVPLQCVSEVGQLVLTLPVPSAESPVASQERLVESWRSLLCFCNS